MTVQTIKLAGKQFVIMAEKDYRKLVVRAPARASARRRLSAQDKGDIGEAIRRLNDPAEKPIPYEQCRKELGLA